MYLNLFRQDIKKIFLLIAFQQSLNSGQKTTEFFFNFRRYWQILVKNRCRFTAGDLKAFFLYFFCFDFFTLTLATIFISASFLPKVSKVKERGWKLNFGFRKWKKLAGVSKTIAAVAVAPAFRVLQRWKKQCNQISNGCLEKFQKKLAS
jgi:hypothetical protein